MRRLSVFIAAVLACAIFSATPALAQEAAAVPVAAPTAVQAVGSAQPGLLPQNWFTDWNTCIWGIGTPTALAWRYPGTAKNIALGVLRSRDRNGLVRAYGEHVVSACERFIRS